MLNIKMRHNLIDILICYNLFKNTSDYLFKDDSWQFLIISHKAKINVSIVYSLDFLHSYTFF